MLDPAAQIAYHAVLMVNRQCGAARISLSLSLQVFKLEHEGMVLMIIFNVAT